jgi:hypothetical protein
MSCGRRHREVRHTGEYELAREIVELSVATTWDKAKLEWWLEDVYEADEPETCLCGHFPIIEICVLRNNINGREAVVGNCCVRKFIGLPSDKIFQAVKRVRKDSEKSLNAETIQHAFDHRWINQWEYDFYFSIMRKRNLSDKQLAIKRRINATVLARMQRGR